MRVQFASLVKQPPVPIASIRILAKEARNKKFDDVAWDIYLYLCQSEQIQSVKARTCRTAFDLAVVLNEQPNLFNTAVFAFHHTQEKQFQTFAQQYATTKAHRAMLIIAEGNIPDFSTEDLALPESSVAELDYLIGKKTSDVERLDRALTFFVSHRFQGKVADALFVKAKIAWEQKNKESAKIWASESALILEQIKQYKQASFVREWFDVRFSTR